jgi:uncharacterized small protein (DUF1192 family)
MIIDEDTDPKTKRPKLRPLDNMSVPELKDYLDQLKQEAVRVEAEIQKKDKYKDAAAALFKSST